jgi:hypothetical protein
VIGGINGFGRIIVDTSRKYDNTVFATGRSCNESAMTTRFELGQPVSPSLYQMIDQSDVLIMNATKTLEGDESVWNTRLSTFDASLLIDRIQTNVMGYVKLLQQLCAHRVNLLEHRQTIHPLVMIYVDANESKCENKMVDGKHLELNIAKSAVKQILYTNYNLLTKLNIKVVCYDPGWLSYHGISLERQRSLSHHLIPPTIAAMGLLSASQQPDDRIVETSVYDFITDNK